MHNHTVSRFACCVLLAGTTAACSSGEGPSPGGGGTGNPTAGSSPIGGSSPIAGSSPAAGAMNVAGSVTFGGFSSGGSNFSGSGGASGGVVSTGGVSTGGSGGASGGLSAGGSSGATHGGDGAGGTSATAGSGGKTGGAGRGGQGSGTGGQPMGGSGGGTATIPLKNTPQKSTGCDKATQVTSGEKMIMSDGKQRSYTIDVPTNYDSSKPHKLIYASHWVSSNDESVVRQNYYNLKTKATQANESVIFVAPQALPGDPNGTWSSTPGDDVDHVFFDDLLAFVKSNLCIDTTRVFAIGFSYGGMQTYSLSLNHQKDIRAAVGISPANYNIYVPPKTNLPIAWMQTTGLTDTLTPWDRNGGGATDGAKFIALEHAKNNGCTVPADVPTWKSGSFLCYDFEGCNPSTPTKACTYNGGHDNVDGRPWIADEAWKFFMQF